jgi:uncharacterized protein YdhG (YjbR/CyaY superfamily)
MKTGNKIPKDIDEYISEFPVDIQDKLQKYRSTIKAAAPGATEDIRYMMPTFRVNGSNLVHFAAYKSHIGFYPAPSGIEEFKQELSKYDGAKGTIRFPIEKPLPYDLITRIVKFRLKENQEKAEKKAKKKKQK